MVALSGQHQVAGRCRGAFNLRGVMVPVYDLAGPAALSSSRLILVCRATQGLVGVVVDEVIEVVSMPEQQVSTRVLGLGNARTLVREGDALCVVISPDAVAADED